MIVARAERFESDNSRCGIRERYMPATALGFVIIGEAESAMSITIFLFSSISRVLY